MTKFEPTIEESAIMPQPERPQKQEVSISGGNPDNSRREVGNFRGIKDIAESVRIQRDDLRNHEKLRSIREIFNDSETDYFTKKKIQWLYWPNYSSERKKREIIRATWEMLEFFPDTKEIHQNRQESDLSDEEVLNLLAFLRNEIPEYFEILEKERHKELYFYLDERHLHERYHVFPHHTFLNDKEIHESCIYSRVSQKYGCIYDQNEDLNTLFSLSGFEKNGKIVPERLDMNSLFQQEGLYPESIGKDFYQKLLKDYKYLLSPFIRYLVEKSFEIRLNDFPIRVQIQFLEFLSKRNEVETRKVKKFIQDGNSTDRLKSFLSLEKGGENMGDAILAIGEKLPEEAADRVFAKYAEMAEVARGAAEYVEKSLKAPEKSSPEVIARVAETLLVRAKNMLVEFSEADTSEENDVHALFAKLDSFRADIELYKATLTAFARSGEPLGLDDMEQSRFEAVHAEALSDMDRGVMRDMYLRNIAGSPERVRAKLLANLDRNFENPDATFYVFRYENRVEGFLCFSQDQEGKARGEKFGSAFNVNPDFQKGTIGMMMHEEATNREAENFAIRIECLPEKRSSARYIESGFVGTRLWDDDGEMVLDAVRDDRKKENFHSKVLSREEIMMRDGGEERDGVLALSFERAEDIPFEQYVGSYALTRYFFDAQRNRWFLVFEKHETSEI